MLNSIHHGRINKSIFGVNILDLDFGVQVDSVNNPIKRDSVGSGHVSHRRTSAFDNRLDHYLILQNAKHGLEVCRFFAACDNVIHIRSLIIISVTMFLPHGDGVLAFESHLATGFPVPERYWKISTPASKEDNIRFCRVVRH